MVNLWLSLWDANLEELVLFFGKLIFTDVHSVQVWTSLNICNPYPIEPPFEIWNVGFWTWIYHGYVSSEKVLSYSWFELQIVLEWLGRFATCMLMKVLPILGDGDPKDMKFWSNYDADKLLDVRNTFFSKFGQTWFSSKWTFSNIWNMLAKWITFWGMLTWKPESAKLSWRSFLARTLVSRPVCWSYGLRKNMFHSNGPEFSPTPHFENNPKTFYGSYVHWDP